MYTYVCIHNMYTYTHISIYTFMKARVALWSLLAWFRFASPMHHFRAGLGQVGPTSFFISLGAYPYSTSNEQLEFPSFHSGLCLL